MTANHTPLPLPLRCNDDGFIFDASGSVIGSVRSSLHAPHVVQACNAYPVLVEALKKIANPPDLKRGQWPSGIAAQSVAREALRKAGVK